MDLININIDDKKQIKKIIELDCFTSSKDYLDKQILRLGNKGIRVIVKKRNNDFYKLNIQLKPHYYYNNDLHNGNMMNSKDTIDVLREIGNKLYLTKNNVITSLEFGLNTVPDFYDTKNIINQSLYYKKKPLIYTRADWNYFKTTKEKDTHPTIYTKIYHKKEQGENYLFDDIEDNTLRYENGFTSNRKIKDTFNVTNYQDLIDLENIKKFGIYLLNSWDYMLILDEIRDDIDICNPNHYSDLKHFRNGLLNARINYYKSHGILHKEIKSLLDYTYHQKFLKVQNPTLIDSLNLHKTNSVETLEPLNKKCSMTNIDISMQRDDSKFLHTTGLNYYQLRNIELYEKILHKYWSFDCKGKKGNELHKIISHNIRNEYYNNLYSLQKKFPKELGRFNFMY
jgi:hypothetical protein